MLAIGQPFLPVPPCHLLLFVWPWGTMQHGDSGRLPSFLGEGLKSLEVFPALRPHLPRGGRSHPSFQARPRWLSRARGHEAAIPLQRPLHCVSTRKAETRQLFSCLRHVQPAGVRSCGRLLISAANQSGSEMTQGPPSRLVQANGKGPKLLQGALGLWVSLSFALLSS